MGSSGGSGLSRAATRIQAALDRFGLDLAVREFPESTRTAAEAAETVGCDVAQIAKSLIFRGKTSGRPVLVVASGANRVDLDKVRSVIGEGLGKADAEFVRDKTGYSIGGVPPIAHDTPPLMVIDRDLLALPEIWTAAGTPNAVFRLTPESLVAITGAAVADIRAE